MKGSKLLLCIYVLCCERTVTKFARPVASEIQRRIGCSRTKQDVERSACPLMLWRHMITSWSSTQSVVGLSHGGKGSCIL